MPMKPASQNTDNLGLVAGMCNEIGIKDIIDSACGKQAKNKNLTFGECIVCMILNGLGFVGRTLYLYSQYFEDKPIDHLLDKPVRPQNISDNVLGRTLDKLFELDVSKLFSYIALQAMKKLGIQVKSLHLDATSFHVDGEYESLLEQRESRIQLTHDYSRDHRPELKQAEETFHSLYKQQVETHLTKQHFLKLYRPILKAFKKLSTIVIS